MDFLVELIFDIIFEGSMELASNRKIPKLIRYPLITLLIIFLLAIIGLLFYAGIRIKAPIFIKLLLIAVAVIFFVAAVIKFKKLYFKRYK